MAETGSQDSSSTGNPNLRWTLLAFCAVILSAALGVALPRADAEKGLDYLALAAQYQAAGHAADARRSLDRAVSLGVDSGSQWAEAGRLYQRLSAPDRAIQAFSRAVRLAPDNADFRLGLARSYAAAGQEQEALAAYQELVRRAPPGSESALLEMGFRFVALKEYATGEKHYLHALTVYTQSIPLRSVLSDLYVAWERPDDGIRWLEEAVQLEAPPATGIFMKLGQVYLAQGKPEQALDAFEEAVARQPTDAEAYFWQGEAQSALGHRAEAVTAYYWATVFRPAFISYRRKLGAAYLSVGQCEKAQEVFWDVLNIGPNDALGLEGLRRCARP
ncbi:MAG: tetratricopeptide repeat protein [Anaerolineae bacterium]|nr:tetratricopeptide repeat protein [Anaerolineae bacterium]